MIPTSTIYITIWLSGWIILGVLSIKWVANTDKLINDVEYRVQVWFFILIMLCAWFVLVPGYALASGLRHIARKYLESQMKHNNDEEMGYED